VRTRLLFIGVPLVAAALAAGAVFAFARGSDDGPGDPGAFMTNLFEEIAGNDYATAWQTLHPAQQRVATQNAYVSCESQSPIPGKLASVTVVDVSDEDVQVAGQGTTAGKAVRVKLSITGIGEPIVVTHTGHAVAVGDHWTWILPPERFAEYKAGRCP
jgi:hypothetical protein